MNIGCRITTFVKKFGKNRWIILIHLLTWFSGLFYAELFSAFPSWDYLFLQIFYIYNLFVFGWVQKRLFSEYHSVFESNPPIHPHWKRWFFILYTPHILFSVVFFVMMTFLHHAVQSLVVSMAILFSVYCTYLRFSLSDEGNSNKNPTG